MEWILASVQACAHAMICVAIRMIAAMDRILVRIHLPFEWRQFKPSRVFALGIFHVYFIGSLVHVEIRMHANEKIGDWRGTVADIRFAICFHSRITLRLFSINRGNRLGRIAATVRARAR